MIIYYNLPNDNLRKLKFLKFLKQLIFKILQFKKLTNWFFFQNCIAKIHDNLPNLNFLKFW